MPEHRDSAAVFGDFSSKDVDTLSDDNSCAKKKMRGERKGAGASEGVSEEIRIDRSMNAGANKAHDEQGQNGKGERKDGRKEVEPRKRSIPSAPGSPSRSSRVHLVGCQAFPQGPGRHPSQGPRSRRSLLKNRIRRWTSRVPLLKYRIPQS